MITLSFFISFASRLKRQVTPAVWQKEHSLPRGRQAAMAVLPAGGTRGDSAVAAGEACSPLQGPQAHGNTKCSSGIRWWPQRVTPHVLSQPLRMRGSSA